MKVPLIWKKMLVENYKVVNSSNILKWAKELNKNELNSIDYLQKHGYLVRIIRGIFYVVSPDEREMGYFECSIFERIAMAMEAKGVKKWYFGLESALKLNNMTHEYFDINHVFTDSYMTTKIIKISDSNFRFYKRKKEHFKFGIMKKSQIYFSDPERTVLDLAYNRYLKSKEPNYFLSPIKEHHEVLDPDKLGNYLSYYSQRFQKGYEAIL